MGWFCFLNGLQSRSILGLVQHTRLSCNFRLITHHAVHHHLGSHNPCSCYCSFSHSKWPLWLCAGQIDLQSIFIRKLLFLVSLFRRLQNARDSYWLGPAGVATLPSTAEMVVKQVMGPALFRPLVESQSPAMDPAEVQKAIHVWTQCLATAAPNTDTVDHLQRKMPCSHLRSNKHTDGDRYCATGCKTAFGACSAKISLTTLQTSTRSSAPAVASNKVTKNARCCYGNGIKSPNLGQTCSGSQWGNCCSQYDSDAYLVDRD